MTSLRQTAEAILEMCGRGSLHNDPKVDRQILVQDIMDIIEKPMQIYRDEVW